MNVADIQNFFTAADTNHNGYLTASEFKKAIASKSTDIQQTLSAFLNDKGKINSAAFNAVAGDDKKMTQAELLALLTTTDEDDNVKVVDDDELEKQYDNLSTISSLDSNGDGKISTSEILKAYNNASADSDMKKLLANFVETNEKGKLQVNKSKVRVLSGGKSYITYQDLLKTDTDSSGMASAEELSTYFEPTSTFTSVDTNGDGKLSNKEILNAYNNAAADSDTKNLLANFVETNAKGKLQVNKSKIRVLSGGNTYLTYQNLLSADSDSNGTVTADETSSYLESSSSFTSIDANGDGKLTSKEILNAYNSAASGSELKALLANFVTKNNKGKLQVNMSKIRIMSGGNKYLAFSDLLKADSDSNGTPSATEVNKYLSSFEEFSVLDINGDGKVTLSEMKSYAKATTDSALATYISSLATSKEMKRVFKILSNGKNYLTTDDIAKYDTNGNGVICTGELATFKKAAQGVVDTTKSS